MHKPIILSNIRLSFGNSTCFEDFSTYVYAGNRIAIIGRNGSGKSSFLKLLCGKLQPSHGEIRMPEQIRVAYVEQTITEFQNHSGGQRFNKRLSQALADSPDLLLLDEPTNHLDTHNRTNLMGMLRRYEGTLIFASHDTALIKNCCTTLWHIDDATMHIFSGSYEAYMQQRKQQAITIKAQLHQLKRQTKDTHNALMKEQKRAAKSKRKGQKSIDQRKWPTVVSKAKALSAEQTSGKKRAALDAKKSTILEKRARIRLPETITPTFSLPTNHVTNHQIVSIRNASVGYICAAPIIKKIYMSVTGAERIALCGNNGSGKSTLLKAILQNEHVVTTGSWKLPSLEAIGYLDQHYDHLNPEKTVIDHVRATCPDWDRQQLRHHLQDFLFRKNEIVTRPIKQLSGGEKARLSLCLIAAQRPKLLILDELTNNIDLETKTHITEVLRAYPGAMIVVSHDEDFLHAIDIDHSYTIEDGHIKIRNDAL